MKDEKEVFFKLGKKIKLRYIPITEIVNPVLNQMGDRGSHTQTPYNSRPLSTVKSDVLSALMFSIREYGLLKPLEVMKEKRDHGGRVVYYLIDGQRRYLAIRKLLHLDDEKIDIPYSVEKNVLLPCLVYPYKDHTEGIRHSVEDNRFSVRPSTTYLDIAERGFKNVTIVGERENLSCFFKQVKDGE